MSGLPIPSVARAGAACLLLSFGALGAQARFDVLDRLPAEPGSQTRGFGIAAYASIADMNGDQFVDVVVSVGWLSLNNRRSGLGPWQTLSPPPPVVTGYSAVADFDGDGDLDLLNPGLYPYGIDSPRLFLNDGTGRLRDVSATHMPVHPIDCPVAEPCDVDGDGDIDVVFGAYWNGRQPRPVSGFVYLNDGTGHFTFDPQDPRMPPDTESDSVIRAIDVDGDRDCDLVIGRGIGVSQIYINDGTGHFSAGQPLPPGMCGVIRIGDLDNDGDPDLGLFVFGSSQQPILCLNDGLGNFTDISARVPYIVYSGLCDSGTFADIDEDGDLDLLIPINTATAVSATEWVSMLQIVNDGTAHFTDMTVANMPNTVSDRFAVGWLDAADFDRDGDLDILASDWTGSRHQSVFWNMTRQIYAPTPARVGQPWELQVTNAPNTVVVPAAALQPGRFDLGAVGILGLDPATTVVGPGFVIPSGGMERLPMTVPNDVRLVGRHLYWQCLFVENSPPRVILSNTFDETIGS